MLTAQTGHLYANRNGADKLHSLAAPHNTTGVLLTGRAHWNYSETGCATKFTSNLVQI